MAKKAKEVVAKAPKDPVMVWIGVSGAAAAVAAIVALVLSVRSSRMELLEQQSERQYSQMKDMMTSILAMRASGAKTPKVDEKPDDLTAFLSQKWTEAQLPTTQRSILPGARANAGAWKEYPTTISAGAGKDGPISRAALVQYLSSVEAARPYLKARELLLTFSGSDFSSVSVTFSLFRRE